MAKITKLTSQKKGDRVNVFLDGEFAFGVEYETAVKFALKKDMELDGATIKKIKELEGDDAAFERGLKYAVKKLVSVKQMNEYLTEKGFSAQATARALDKLLSYGYLDDEKFAFSYVATYGGARGARRIRPELKAAGIDEEIIGRALSSLDEDGACDDCIDKFLRTHREVDSKKLYNYLLYRGFRGDVISDALSRRGLWK